MLNAPGSVLRDFSAMVWYGTTTENTAVYDDDDDERRALCRQTVPMSLWPCRVLPLCAVLIVGPAVVILTRVLNAGACRRRSKLIEELRLGAYNIENNIARVNVRVGGESMRRLQQQCSHCAVSPVPGISMTELRRHTHNGLKML